MNSLISKIVIPVSLLMLIISMFSCEKINGQENDKDYYLYPVAVEDSGLGSSGKYWFKIMHTEVSGLYFSLVRINRPPLIVEKNIPWIPFM